MIYLLRWLRQNENRFEQAEKHSKIKSDSVLQLPRMCSQLCVQPVCDKMVSPLSSKMLCLLDALAIMQVIHGKMRLKSLPGYTQEKILYYIYPSQNLKPFLVND